MSKEVVLAPYIPDRVRIYFDESTHFPRRILYLKKAGDTQLPMLTLDFLNVQQNAPVSADDFTFYPPEGAVSQDVTQGIIEQIIRSAEKDQSPDSEENSSGEKNSGK